MIGIEKEAASHRVSFSIDLFVEQPPEASDPTGERDRVRTIQRQIAQFIQARNHTLLNLQPDIGQFLQGDAATTGPLGTLSLSANDQSLDALFATSLGRIWSTVDRNRSLAGTETGAAGPTVKTRPVQPTGSGRVYASAQVPPPGAAYAAARRRGYDVWLQLQGARADLGDTETSLWAGFAGAHTFVSDNLIVGALVQLDWAETDAESSDMSTDGNGWMVGPYFAAKLPDQNVFINARAAWGRSDNDLSNAGSTGGFETQRYLLRGEISGRLQHNNWTISPTASLSYFEEEQEDFSDSLGTAIGAQTFSIGELRFGPRFTYLISGGGDGGGGDGGDGGDGGEGADSAALVRTHFGIDGVWNFDIDNNHADSGDLLGSDEVRARLSIGLDMRAAESWNLHLSAFYDGIGADDYEAAGARLRLAVPLP